MFGRLLAPAAPGGAGRGYGPLLPDPAGILDLPTGFAYRIVSRAGDVLSNGAPLPGSFDGTGAFAAPGGNVRLVRNHEQGDSATYSTVAPAPAALVYDPGAAGGRRRSSSTGTATGPAST